MKLNIEHDELMKILLDCGFVNQGKRNMLFSADNDAYIFISATGPGFTHIMFYNHRVAGSMPFLDFLEILPDKLRDNLSYHLDIFNQ